MKESRRHCEMPQNFEQLLGTLFDYQHIAQNSSLTHIIESAESRPGSFALSFDDLNKVAGGVSTTTYNQPMHGNGSESPWFERHNGWPYPG